MCFLMLRRRIPLPKSMGKQVVRQVGCLQSGSRAMDPAEYMALRSDLALFRGFGIHPRETGNKFLMLLKSFTKAPRILLTRAAALTMFGKSAVCDHKTDFHTERFATSL